MTFFGIFTFVLCYTVADHEYELEELSGRITASVKRSFEKIEEVNDKIVSSGPLKPGDKVILKHSYYFENANIRMPADTFGNVIKIEDDDDVLVEFSNAGRRIRDYIEKSELEKI